MKNNINRLAIKMIIAMVTGIAVGLIFMAVRDSIGSLLLIMVLALIASIGTTAALGAGAVILFTILSGMGFTGEAAMMGYTLILAINRPIEMPVTSLNCVGDSVAAMAVAKREGKLDESVYNS